MKEILKYLRSVNLYSQVVVAEAIGLSRQSYNKYEAGTVIPSDKIVKKLADFYSVTPEFIKNNQIPQLPGKQEKSEYSKKCKGPLLIASPSPAYCVKTLEKIDVIESKKTADTQVQTYRAIYNNGKIELKDAELNFPEGQELLITVRPETEEEEIARKKKAWHVIEDFINSQEFTSDESDPDYEKLRREVLNEKYGPF